MSGISLAQAEEKLQAWLDAETNLQISQSYEIEMTSGARRKLTRSNLSEVRESIKFWDNKVKELSRAAQNRGGIRFMGASPKHD